MKLEIIGGLLDDGLYWNIPTEVTAREIYKLHLQEKLLESHCIYDVYCSSNHDEFRAYMQSYNMEIKQQLKELE